MQTHHPSATHQNGKHAIHRPRRRPLYVDLTALADIAFLLLTFYLGTTTGFREQRQADVKLPHSTSCYHGHPEICMISINSEGQIFIGYSNRWTKIEVLHLYLDTYNHRNGTNISLQKAGVEHFLTINEFGVSQKLIPIWLSQQSNSSLLNFPQAGIPFHFEESQDSKTCELNDWIDWGIMTESRIRFAIRGDVNMSYEMFSRLISLLQAKGIHSFSLITNREGSCGSDLHILDKNPS